MKSLLLILLFSLFIISNSILGGWKKGSYRENDIGIDRAFKKAFEIHSIFWPNSDIDFTNRLTIYRQYANGINYLMCFIDLKKNLNVVHEYIINGPPFSSENRNPNFEFIERNIFKPKKGLLSDKDSRYPRIKTTLYDYAKKLNQNILYINKIEIIDTTMDNFYIVTGRTEEKEHIYIIGQNRQNTDEYEAYEMIQ